MTTIALTLAALICLAWTGVHLFMGGAEVARPLRETNILPPLVRGVAWMCWHMVSIAIAINAVLFALGAYTGGHGYIVGATLLSGGFAFVGIIAAPMMGQSYAKMPQGWLFLPPLALGLFALS